MCKTKQWSQAGADAIGNCLKNKSVYLLGDSTTRQWAYELFSLLKTEVKLVDMSQKYRRYLPRYNLNITYQFYPQILGSKTVRIKDEMYEVDVMDRLVRDASCNYVVVISPWAHFTQWWADAYRERLQLLMESVQRLKSRCPDTPVILKSPHVRDHKDAYTHLLNSDYILYRMKIQMEEVFRNAGVFYVDIWDMNLAYPANKTVHMPREVIRQELNLALSYVCRGGSPPETGWNLPKRRLGSNPPAVPKTLGSSKSRPKLKELKKKNK